MASSIARTCALLCCSVAAITAPTLADAPTDNPVAAYYSGANGYPAWTDAVKWTNVIDMSEYAKGKTSFEKFETARDELAARGGGVLYYPGGTYDFSDMPADGPRGRGLMLKSGIVIRGEMPKADSDARKGKLDLPTKFVFGFRKMGVDEARKLGGEAPRDWNIIGLAAARGQELKDVHNVGVCWVQITGGAICFGPQLKWGKTWGEAGAWKSRFVKPAWKDRVPDGTSPLDPFLGAPGGKDQYVGAGHGRLVFGCVLADSAVLNDVFQEGNGEGAFYMFKFGARIAAYGSRIFIANNLLPKPTRCFKYAQTTRKTAAGKGGNSMILGDFVSDTVIMFDYGKTCGIDVNKDFAAAFGPAGLFEEGVVVRDNHVFNHGHRGYNISGAWVTIRNNINDRLFLKGGADVYGLGEGWTLTLDGCLRSSAGGNGTISDNLARAFDLGGKQLWIDGNFFHDTGSDPGNDGEGILCQAHGGTHLIGWAVTRNRHEKGAGATSYMGGWDVDMLGCLMAWNETPGWVGITKVSQHETPDCAIIGNKCSEAHASADMITESPKAPPAAPRGVRAAVYGGDAVKVTWTDASDTEIGFRIDRSLDGGKTWAAVAYRPPHAKNTDPDALVWIDFVAPARRPLRYRVAAINADDNDGGASAASEAVTVAP